MPEIDALHKDAERINVFAERHFISATVVQPGYVVPGTEAWPLIEVSARSRGKELCIAMRAAVRSQRPEPISTGAMGHSWFPDAERAPRAFNTPCRPPPMQAISAGDVALVTLQRVMDGAVHTIPPSEPIPGTALLVIRRDDGAAIVFVADNTPRTERLSSGRRAIPGRLLLGMWSANRSPDPVWEYEAFRAGVLRRAPMLDAPICEVLLDQSIFNGAVPSFIPPVVLLPSTSNPTLSRRLLCSLVLCSSTRMAQEWATIFAPRSSTARAFHLSNRRAWSSRTWRRLDALAAALKI